MLELIALWFVAGSLSVDGYLNAIYHAFQSFSFCWSLGLDRRRRSRPRWDHTSFQTKAPEASSHPQARLEYERAHQRWRRLVTIYSALPNQQKDCLLSRSSFYWANIPLGSTSGLLPCPAQDYSWYDQSCYFSMIISLYAHPWTSRCSCTSAELRLYPIDPEVDRPLVFLWAISNDLILSSSCLEVWCRQRSSVNLISQLLAFAFLLFSGYQHLRVELQFVLIYWFLLFAIR